MEGFTSIYRGGYKTGDWRKTFTFGKIPSEPSNPHVKSTKSTSQFIAMSPAKPSLFSRFLSWIHDNQAVAAALILLFTVAIYCLATRYAAHPHLALSIDRWTGQLIRSE